MSDISKIDINHKGSLYIVISALLFGSYGVWSRMIEDSFGYFSQAWSRGLLLFLFCLIIGHLSGKFKKILRKDLKWFFLIALCGGLNQAPYMFGFENLPIGSATLLFYVALVFGGYLVGVLIMGELLDRIKIISLVLSIIGIIFLYRFTLDQSQLLSAIMVIIAGLMGAGSAVLPKKLSSEYSEIQILTAVLASMFIFNLLISFMLGESLPALQLSIGWLGWVCYAGSQLVANLAVISGFKYLDATWGSIIGTTEIIFALIFGIIFFNEALTYATITGSLIILLAILLPYLKPDLLRKSVR